MIGKHLSPVLKNIEHALWEWELHKGDKPEYSTEGFRAAVKIFISALMDRIWELQELEEISIEDRILMVEKAGRDVRALVKTYTNIDTHEMHKDNAV